MINQFNCVALAPALEQLKRTVVEDKSAGMRTIIFCESRFTLDIEKAVCDAVGGTFDVDVYTFKRFLSKEGKRDRELFTDMQSLMIVRSILNDVWKDLRFKDLSLDRLTCVEAAQSVYDAISHMVCSGVSPQQLEDIKPKLESENKLLADKVHDIAIVYAKYMEFLNGNNVDGKLYKDKNTSLGDLPACISGLDGIGGTDAVFFGYQTFNKLELAGVETAMRQAKDVNGIFIHEDGPEAPGYYGYAGAAADVFRVLGSSMAGWTSAPAGSRDLECCAAETLRRQIFNPEIVPEIGEGNCRKIVIKEAPDSVTELEYIAAEIKNIMAEGGMRYRDIGVMVPGLDDCEREISRAFRNSGIPYYAARRYPLEAHPLCTYILSLLSCVVEGCRPEDVDDVILSPFFPGTQDQKNFFRAYLMRFGNYKWSVLDEDWSRIGKLCFHMRKNNDDFKSYTFIRDNFMNMYNILLKHGDRYAAGLKDILEHYHLKSQVSRMAENAAKTYPEEANAYSQVYDKVYEVLDAVDRFAGVVDGPECLRMVHAGFASTKIALSVRNTDGVFVGDFNSTVNTSIGSGSNAETWAGSKVVFCARLTGDVPAVKADDGFISDAEWGMLGAALSLGSDVIPYTSERTNSMNREAAALNICSFTDRLYLTYPTEIDGKETEYSEIIYYAQKIFGKKIEAIPVSADKGKGKLGEGGAKTLSKALALDLYMPDAENRHISPTTIETYFQCPYKMFMSKGIKAEETLQGSLQAVDTGSFVHDVMQKITPELIKCKSVGEFNELARAVGEKLMVKAPYAALDLNESGRVRKAALLDSIEVLASNLYNQHIHTSFKPLDEERDMIIRTTSSQGFSYSISGRIDRVDTCGNMVRVIDYKTGSSFSADYPAYYMGKKLQLELYLVAAAGISEGPEPLRPVASYYLPCNVEYGSDDRFVGFTDTSDDVMDVLWRALNDNEKFKQYIKLKDTEELQDEETFRAFLDYSMQVSGQAIDEMLDGYIEPSPEEGACGFCKYAGCCCYSTSRNGIRANMSADGISITCVAHPELKSRLCPETEDAAVTDSADGDEE